MGTKKVVEQAYELKYNGMLVEAKNVYVRYGYTNWTDVSECKMRKLKSGYKAEIEIPEGSELNFCFRDEFENWDNNNGNNYFYMPGSDAGYSFLEITTKDAKQPVKTSATRSAKPKTQPKKTTTTKTSQAKTATKKTK